MVHGAVCIYTQTSVLHIWVARCVCMFTHMYYIWVCMHCVGGCISAIYICLKPGIPASPDPQRLTYAVARAEPWFPLGWDNETTLGYHSHTPHCQALPLRSPARSWRLRLLSGWCKEGTESLNSFLSCHRLSCSILSPQVHDHGLLFQRAGVGYWQALQAAF